MKPWRPIVAVAAFVALAFVYNVDRRESERAVLRSVQRLQVLFQVPDRVYELGFENANGQIRLVREDGRTGRWIIVEPRELPAAPDVVAAFLENLRGARRQSELPLDDLARFGLDNPRQIVTVSFVEETGRPRTARLLFGDQPIPGGPVYAAIEGEGTVFTVSEWLLRNSGHNLSTIRDHRLTQRQVGEFLSFDIDNPAGRFTVSRADLRSPWVVDIPGRGELPVDRVLMERVLGNLSGGRFLSFIEDDEDVETGLSLPIVTVSVDGEEIIAVGARVPDREQFFVLTETDEIATIARSVVGDFFRPAIEWGTKRFVWANPSDVVEVQSSSGNSRLFIRNEGGEWLFPDSPDVDVRQDRARQLVESITSLSARSLVSSEVSADQLAGFGFLDETFRLSVTLADGRTEGFRFGRTDTRDRSTLVLRERDMSLWSIDFTLQHLVFQFRTHLEDRRLLTDLERRTHRVEIEFEAGQITLERRGNQWFGTMPGEVPAVIPPGEVSNFLISFEEMERGTETRTITPRRGEVTFRFFEEGQTAAFEEISVVDRDPVTRFVILQQGNITVEVPPDDFENLDNAIVKLVVRIQQSAEQARQ